MENKTKVTETQLRTFLHVCWVKYVKARIEPGRGFLTSYRIRAHMDMSQALLLEPLVLNPSVNPELK